MWNVQKKYNTAAKSVKIIDENMPKIGVSEVAPWWRIHLLLPETQETVWVWFLGWQVPCRRKCQPTPVLLPGESQGQRSFTRLQSMGLQSQILPSTHAHRHMPKTQIMQHAPFMQVKMITYNPWNTEQAIQQHSVEGQWHNNTDFVNFTYQITPSA